MLLQATITVVFVLGVIGLFWVKSLIYDSMYGREDHATSIREQTDRAGVQQYALIGGVIGAGLGLAFVVTYTALAINSTGAPPSGHIGWSVLLAAAVVPGGGLFGVIGGTILGWLTILFHSLR